MDRRATLAALLGRKTSSKKGAKTRAMSTAVVTGLTPYTGPWGFEQAAHLMRRSTMGPNYALIKEAQNLGLDATIAALLADTPMPDPPLNSNNNNDPNVPIGETWIDAPYSDTVNLFGYRTQSLYAWNMGVMVAEGMSVREKMTLFWHNHFVTSLASVSDAKFIYRYITTLRSSALGNFRQLVKDVTIDPAMLRYLNGSQNTKTAPNENYARELLELFTIGKGQQVGPGDYTNYTEQDVSEIAKVLTGWRDTGYRTTNPATPVGSNFVPNRHDNTTKQLSYRFDDVQIPNAGADEYKNLVDIIFLQDEVARFICRKLYRWFVYYVIDATVETDVIEPLAQVLIDNDYDIVPALETLLKSEHFFDALSIGPMIKNPVDFVLTASKTVDMPIPANLNGQYRAWLKMAEPLSLLQMQIFNPPDVAGWKAYYQEPLFYRTWINSVTLPYRMQITDGVTTTGISAGGGVTLKIDVLALAATLDDPADPNQLIDDLSKILLPQPITENQKTFLKNILLPGLPDYEWTIEYADYLADPTNPVYYGPIELQLRLLLKAMMNLPEFYLS
ncbi:MAG: DUF1800 domain-containing protein [Saprospirales bacterium]|nr:DUF1800 domain-containing protein [Saprospirales bacterium]